MRKFELVDLSDLNALYDYLATEPSISTSDRFRMAEDRVRGAPDVSKNPNGCKAHDPGAKLDGNKVDLDLVLGDFSLALIEVGKIGTDGAKKYSRSGWLKVPDALHRYSSALLRHFFLDKKEAYDKDSGSLHKAHVAWNALAILELELRKTAK